MPRNGYSDHKDKILKRLTRAEGQIRGISRMVAEDTYCIDVLTQISAAQAALDKVAMELLRDHACNCLQIGTPHQPATPAARKAANQKADELVAAVGRLLGR